MKTELTKKDEQALSLMAAEHPIRPYMPDIQIHYTVKHINDGGLPHIHVIFQNPVYDSRGRASNILSVYPKGLKAKYNASYFGSIGHLVRWLRECGINQTNFSINKCIDCLKHHKDKAIALHTSCLQHYELDIVERL